MNRKFPHVKTNNKLDSVKFNEYLTYNIKDFTSIDKDFIKAMFSSIPFGKVCYDGKNKCPFLTNKGNCLKCVLMQEKVYVNEFGSMNKKCELKIMSDYK